MGEGILKITHLEFEVEEFKIDNPQYNIVETEGGITEFTIRFETSEAIIRAPELEETIDAEPMLEATAILSGEEANLKAGQTITQQEGYDYERDEWLSNIYYFEHNSVEELEVKILEIHEDWIRIDVKGKAIINGSSEDAPDAELYIQNTRFFLDKDLRREVE